MILLPEHKWLVHPGDVVNGLTVVGSPFLIRSTGQRHRRQCAVVQCNCGEVHAIVLNELLHHEGHYQKCPCTRRLIGSRKLWGHAGRHGGHKDILYRIWASMLNRCYGTNGKRYADYGGRGIRVCDSWLRYPAFRDWATSSGYAKGLSIDRKDNDGNYEPDNCRWATRSEQQRNKRSNALAEYNGRVQCITAWAQEFGLEVNTLKCRLRRGMSMHDALTTPVNQRMSRKGM